MKVELPLRVDIKKGFNKKSRNATIRVDQVTYDRIEDLACTADLRMSEYIRRMIIKGKTVVKQEIIV